MISYVCSSGRKFEERKKNWFLEYQTMDSVQKLSNPERKTVDCYVVFII
jgi:hypothetical protein